MNFKLSYFDSKGLFSTLLWTDIEPGLEERIRNLKPLRRLLSSRGIIYCIGIRDKDENNKPIRLKVPNDLEKAIELCQKFAKSRRY